MAITFPITGVSAAYSASRSPSFTLDTSPIENDIILAVVASNTTSATTDVSGWTNVRGSNTATQPSDNVSSQVMVYHRVTAAEDTANQVTWTLTNLWNATETGRISVTVLRGVALTGELAGVAFTSDAGNAASPWVIPAVTPTANGVAVAGVIGDGTGTAGAVSGWTIQASGSATQTNYIFSRDAAVTSGTPTSQTSTTPSTGEEYVTIVAVFKEYVAPVTHERTGTLDGTSTLTGTGAKVWSRTGTLDGTSTLTGTGLRVAERTGSIDGISTLTGTGLRIAERTGTLDGISTLTGNGLRIAERTGTLDGTSTLAADGTRVVSRTGTIDGTSTLVGTGEQSSGAIVHERTGTITATSTLTGIGAILVPTLKRWDGSTWVSAVVKHGTDWPVVQIHNL